MRSFEMRAALPSCLLALLAACGGSTLSSDKDITAFSVGSATATISGAEIAVTVPYGTDVTSLAPTITSTGASVRPASGAAQDFTNPVTYTVTAADHSTKAYSVTVTASSTLAITSFALRQADNAALSADAVGVVGASHIAVALPNAFAFPASFTPTIASTGASVSPASGAAQEFTATSNVDVSNAVTYTVSGADGNTTKTYSVVLNKTNKNIILFSINGVDGNIVTGGGGGGGGGTGTVNVVLPTGTDLHSLTPLIGFTGLSVNPASGVAQDFSQGPVTYTVTANDATHTTKAFTVTVTAP